MITLIVGGLLTNPIVCGSILVSLIAIFIGWRVFYVGPKLKKERESNK